MNAEYTKVNKWYDKNIKEYTEKSAILLYDQLTYFTSYIPKGGKILDIGCGPGHDTEYFAKKGFQAIGIDFSTGMIDFACRNRTAGEFKKINILELSNYFPKNYFNGIWASSSLTHIQKGDLLKALRQIKKIISPKQPIVLILKKRTIRKNLPKKILFNEFYKKDIISLLNKSQLHLKKIESFSVINSEWLFIHAEK